MSEETTEQVVEEVVEPGQEADPVATLTSDLQRLQAEYANYRKRVERDRAVAGSVAVAAEVLSLRLLPLLLAMALTATTAGTDHPLCARPQRCSPVAALQGQNGPYRRGMRMASAR